MNSFVVFLVIFIAAVQNVDGFVYYMNNGTCSKGVCEVQAGCGIDNGLCLHLFSNSTLYSLYDSPSFSSYLTPQTSWLITLHYKCHLKSDDLFFLGIGNAELRPIDQTEKLDNGWNKYSFFTKISTLYSDQLYIGLYHKEGSCYFDNQVTISPAQITEFQFEKYGPLGHNERILANGTYSSSIEISKFIHGYHRNLDSSTAFWSSYYVEMQPSQFLIFYHSLSVPFTSNPSVLIRTSGTTGGILMVEASTDKSSWDFITNLTSEQEFSCTHFPSVSHVYVKLTAYNALVYLKYYEFRASVSPPTVSGTIIGRENILSIDNENQLANAHISISLATPTHSYDYSTQVPMYFKSDVSNTATQTFLISFTQSFSRSRFSFNLPTIAILPGGITLQWLKYHLAGGIRQYLTFSAVSIYNSSYFINGQMWFYPIHHYLDTTFGEMLQNTSSSSLWWCDSTHHVYQYRKAPSMPALNSKIYLKAARNEKEAFQLVLRTTDSTTLTINSIFITTLTSNEGFTISSDAISVRRIGYMQTELTTSEGNDYALLGDQWPDILYPLDFPYVCLINRNCPFWVVISVGSEVKPGNYTGTIYVHMTPESLMTQIVLQVWDFEIPKHSRLRGKNTLFNSELWPYHNITTENDKLVQWNLYMKSLSEHRIDSGNSPVMTSIYESIQVVNGTEEWSISSSKFIDNYQTYFSDFGFGFKCNNINMPGLPNANSEEMNSTGQISGIFGTYNWGSANHTRLFTSIASKKQALLESLGLINITMVSWFNKPAETDYPFIKNVQTLLHSAAPKIKRFGISPIVEDLYGVVDIWGVEFHDINMTLLKQRLGEEVFITNGINLDKPALDPRVYFWFIQQNGIDGFYSWEIGLWTTNLIFVNETQDPYEDVMSYSSATWNYGNSNHRLFYPPVEWKKRILSGPITNSTPIETIRLELMREGLEDWEYLEMLKEAIEINTGKVPNELINDATKLLQIPKTLINGNTWSVEPEELLEIRDKIGFMLESFSILTKASSSNEQQQQQQSSSLLSSSSSKNDAKQSSSQQQIFVSIIVIIIFDEEITDVNQLENEIATILGIDVSQVNVILISSTEIQVTIYGQTLSVIQQNANTLIQKINDGTIDSGLLRNAIDAYLRDGHSHQISFSSPFYQKCYFFSFIIALITLF